MDDACVVVVTKLEPHLEELRRQGRDDGVAPLDEGHALVVEQLAKAEVEQLLETLEPVGVDMHDREGALVGVHDHERRAGDRLFNTEGPAEPLHECGLARAEVTGEQNEIAGPGNGGQFSGQCARVVGRLRVCSQHAANTLLARTRSARILASTSLPPPCRAAEGWNVGTSVALPYGYVLPRILVMPSLVFSRSFVAKFPSVTMTFGSISSTWDSRYGRHCSISSGFGSRLPGGLHFRTFPI